jgi:putative NADPH-quinone reductase
MPAVLKGFFEQCFRPDFAVARESPLFPWERPLFGKSGRVVVTMGMPALVYRWFYLAHSLRSVERNILAFCGIGPIKDNIIGSVGDAHEGRHAKWLRKMKRFGRRAA